jgi:AcrR family transcriptional regulator
MYKLCKTEHSAARQRELEAGLLKAMTTCRYEDITVSDLCDQLQIPRQSFYRYFDSKDGALHALVDHTLMEFEDYALGMQNGQIRSVQLDLESFFRFWYEKRDLLDATARSNLSGVLIQRAVAYSLTDEIMPRRFLPHDDAQMQRQVIMFGVCGLMSMVFTWHSEMFQTPPREMARFAARILSQPLFPSAEKYM